MLLPLKNDFVTTLLKVMYAILHRNAKCANFCRVILKGSLQLQKCFLKHETKENVIFIQDFEMLTFVRKNGINRAGFNTAQPH